MVSSKSKSKGSIRIPTEIVTEILYRLPAKSLGRFRCVSKEWLSLISDYQFIKTHQKTLNQNHIIFLYGEDDEFLYSNPFHHHETLLTPKELSVVTKYGETFRFGGSCDGLVLVYAAEDEHSYSLLLLNPTTRELVQLPDSCETNILDDITIDDEELDFEYLEIDTIVGFGYDSWTDDYKVVTISYFTCGYPIPPPNDISVQVYSHKTNTWKRAANPPKYFFHYYSHGKDGGVFINGFIHWIAEKKNKRVIVAFSLADEKFNEVPSPKSLKGCIRLLVLGEKLAIFFKGEVWVMNEYGKKESWNKITLHGFDEIQMDEPMVFEDNGYILVADKNHMLIYNVDKRIFSKSVYVWNPKNLKVKGTYIESLFSPKSLGHTKSLSKERLRQISYPNFINHHQKTVNQNHIIFLSNDDSSLYSQLFHHHEALLTPTKLSLELGNAVSFSFCGSLHGLVLVYASINYSSFRLMILNPTTSESMELPDSRDDEILEEYDLDCGLDLGTSVGFGYDSLSDDYKVVTISEFDNSYEKYSRNVEDIVMLVQVYSLRTNTWRRVVDYPYNHSKFPGVFFNGFIHWVASKGHYCDSLVIISFSLADEKFSEVSSPTLSDDCRLFVLNEKLAIFMDGEVWLMNEYGKRESWTKMILHGLDEIQMDKPVVFEDNGNILVADKDRMLMYDVEKGTFSKTVYFWYPKNFKVTGTCIESLVSPKFSITN